MFKGRTEEMDEFKARYAKDVAARTLGRSSTARMCSWGFRRRRAKAEMVKRMADRPLIWRGQSQSKSNRKRRAPARRIASSPPAAPDYPNQVNNVLCFPFIFRGALDAGATTITEEMKLAATRAIADLAQAEQSDVVAMAYGEATVVRARISHPEAVRSAPDHEDLTGSGQGCHGQRRGTRPIADMEAYRQQLTQFVYPPA